MKLKLLTKKILFYLPLLFILSACSNSNSDSIVLDNWFYKWGIINNSSAWIKTSEPKNPSNKISNYIWFKTTLPIREFNDAGLFIYSVDQLFEVYIDGNLVYKFGDLIKEKKFKGYPLNFISLDNVEYCGKELTIRVYSEHTNIGLNGLIKIGNITDIQKQVILEDVDKIIFSIIFIILSAISVFIFYSTKKREKIYLNFALLSLSVGCYSILHSSISRFLINDFVFLIYLEVFFLFLTPVFYNLFVNEIASKKNNFFKYSGYIFLIYLFISFSLAFGGVVQIMSVVEPFHTLLFIDILIILIYMIRSSFKGNKEAIIFLIGNILMFSMVSYDIYNYLHINKDQNTLYNWGVLILFTSIGIILSGRYQVVYELMNSYYADLQNQKEVQEELKAAHYLAVENARLKSDFLANMSHEIRTPINGVIGMTDLLEETTLDKEQKEYLELIKTSSKNLLEIINDILDFSKIEAGKLELEKIEINITHVINEVISSVMLKVSEKNIELLYFIEPDVPKIIKSDPIRLKQVLMNLVSNAVKFTEKGYIYIHVKCDFLDNQIIENDFINIVNIIFSVKDTGIGIPENKVGTLFKSFFQVDTSNTRKYGGTGLGLAISMKIVKLMGGEIGIKTDHDQGTEFTFNIVSEFLKKEEKEKFIDKTISIISDNELTLYVLKNSLSKHFKIFDYNSAKLEEDFKNSDLIILDYIKDKNKYKLLIELLKELKSKKIVLLIPLNKKNKTHFTQSNILVTTKPIKNDKLIEFIFDIFKNEGNKNKLGNIDNAKILALKEESINNKKADELKYKFSEKIPLNILVAEDNMVNQVVIKKLLEKLGYFIKIANNGLEALNFTKEADYDIIFMDIQMPEMNGFEATKKIIETKKENTPKIIALTANYTVEDQKRSFDVGMVDYMTKPVSFDAIQKILEKWGQKTRYT